MTSGATRMYVHFARQSKVFTVGVTLHTYFFHSCSQQHGTRGPTSVHRGASLVIKYYDETTAIVTIHDRPRKHAADTTPSFLPKRQEPTVSHTEFRAKVTTRKPAEAKRW